MSSSPTLIPGASYLSVLAEVPGSLVERLVGWRVGQGLIGPWVKACHITVFLGADTGEDFLPGLSEKIARLSPFEVVLGSPLSFEPVTPVTYLPVVVGAERLVQAHSLCAEVVGRSVSPFPYEPHVTLVHQSDPVVLEASLVDFAGLPDELTRFEVERLSVHRFTEGIWQALGTMRLG